MRRLGRWLSNAVVALSLILALGLGCVYFRSYHKLDLVTLNWMKDSNTHDHLDARTVGGRIEFSRLLILKTEAMKYSGPSPSVKHIQWDLVDFKYERYLDAMRLGRSTPGGGFHQYPLGIWSRRERLINPTLDQTTITLSVPIAYFIALTGILPVLFVARRIRRAYRQRGGRCVECGYDMRASPQRCPECGSSPISGGAAG